MSACPIPEDWRVVRIISALRSGKVIDVPALADAFELDVDDTVAMIHHTAWEYSIDYFMVQERVLH